MFLIHSWALFVYLLDSVQAFQIYSSSSDMESRYRPSPDEVVDEPLALNEDTRSQYNPTFKIQRTFSFL